MSPVRWRWTSGDTSRIRLERQHCQPSPRADWRARVARHPVLFARRPVRAHRVSGANVCRVRHTRTNQARFEWVRVRAWARQLHSSWFPTNANPSPSPRQMTETKRGVPSDEATRRGHSGERSLLRWRARGTPFSWRATAVQIRCEAEGQHCRFGSPLREYGVLWCCSWRVGCGPPFRSAIGRLLHCRWLGGAALPVRFATAGRGDGIHGRPRSKPRMRINVRRFSAHARRQHAARPIRNGTITSVPRVRPRRPPSSTAPTSAFAAAYAAKKVALTAGGPARAPRVIHPANVTPPSPAGSCPTRFPPRLRPWMPASRPSNATGYQRSAGTQRVPNASANGLSGWISNSAPRPARPRLRRQRSAFARMTG